MAQVVHLHKLEKYDSDKICNFIVRTNTEINLSYSDKILLKPNLLSFKKIEKSVNTNPVFF